MKRRAFLASAAAILPAAGLAAASDLGEDMTKVKVSAEINHEGNMVLTVDYPSDHISTSYTTPVNQGEPQQTQIVFRPKAAPHLSKLSQVQERGGVKSFFWLISRRSASP
jgi:hypothetical protein